jgi:hypothetical protein
MRPHAADQTPHPTTNGFLVFVFHLLFLQDSSSIHYSALLRSGEQVSPAASWASISPAAMDGVSDVEELENAGAYGGDRELPDKELELYC